MTLRTEATIVSHQRGAAPLVLHKLTDAAQLAQLVALVKDLACDDSPARRFPGPNPVSLDSTHFPALKKEPYYVCEKTDGVRHLLACCTLLRPAAEPLKLVALVDRAMNAYVLPVARVPKAMFQGTLLDGELVWNRALAHWQFLVFDAVTVSGIPVLNCTLRARLEAARRAVAAYRAEPRDPVRLAIKTFVPCSKMADAEAHLKAAETQYETDGIILTPAISPVVYGRHMGMFKVKFNSRHTVDFLVGGDGRQLCVFDAGRHVQVGTLSSTSPPGGVVECALADRHASVWDLVTVRADKTTANDMFTYQRTLLNMREALTFEHVKAAFAA
jgi:hypothetical protein